ncbi:MAG: hypothetical protein NZ876_12395, partial [Dehalococcoidia bacterium]|nr:hypothetical protein [Dehalococcoidia bacterium]
MLETTDAGRELIDALLCIARDAVPNLAVQKGSRPRKDQQVRPADQLKAIEMLLDRGFGRSPQQPDIAHNVSSRPLEHLSDETLRLLVENARQLEEGSGVVIDEDGQVITEYGIKPMLTFPTIRLFSLATGLLVSVVVALLTLDG